MYAMVTYSTDMRSPNHKIEFTRSKTRAIKACSTEVVLTHQNPELARNFHHNLTRVYVLPTGWKKPSKKWIDDEVFRRRGSIYSPNSSGVLFECITKDGEHFEP